MKTITRSTRITITLDADDAGLLMMSVAPDGADEATALQPLMNALAKFVDAMNRRESRGERV